jgi:hypothetical protein
MEIGLLGERRKAVVGTVRAYREAPTAGKDSHRATGQLSKAATAPHKRSAQALWDYLLTHTTDKQ